MAFRVRDLVIELVPEARPQECESARSCGFTFCLGCTGHMTECIPVTWCVGCTLNISQCPPGTRCPPFTLPPRAPFLSDPRMLAALKSELLGALAAVERMEQLTREREQANRPQSREEAGDG